MRFSSRGIFPCLPASRLAMCCALKKLCESTAHIQSGRQALVSHGRHPLAALAGGGCGALLSPRHVAGAALAGVRPAGGVSSSVAVVAAVGLQLPVHHRLAPPSAPISSTSALDSPLGILTQNELYSEPFCRTTNLTLNCIWSRPECL